MAQEHIEKAKKLETMLSGNSRWWNSNMTESIKCEGSLNSLFFGGINANIWYF